MKIEDTLFITDLDGTLMRDDKSISQKNQEAMKRWISLGGNVTIATGRSIPSVLNHIDDIPINAPAVLFQGGLLYDFEKRQVLWEMNFPGSYRELVEYVYKTYPEVGIELMVRDNIHVIRFNDVVDEHIALENLQYEKAELGQQGLDVIKVLFGVPESETKAFYKDMMSRVPEDVDCVLTGVSYCEIIPKGIHKGSCIDKLKEILGKDYKTICIGDYNNDLEMLQQADFAIAPGNALSNVKEIADYIASSNEQDAIAGAMDYLLKQKIVEY